MAASELMEILKMFDVDEAEAETLAKEFVKEWNK